MSKIIVYGDSYVSNERVNAVAWPNRVATFLGLHIVNNGISGSGTEYAFYKFIEDISTNKIEENDIIIFQFSTSGRLHFDYQLKVDPSTASKFLHNVDRTDPKNAWCVENKKHLDWWLLNFNPRLIEINHECYLHALKTFAEANPKVTILVMFNSKQNNRLPLVNIPQNMLIPNISLYEITLAEQKDNVDYNDWTKYTKWDCRTNHLTETNLNILTKLVTNAIKTKDIKNLQLSSFKHNIIGVITNTREYDYYVNLKIIIHQDDVRSHLL